MRTTPNANTGIIVKFEGYTGRHVWHCHILEYEDNEMMRPYENRYTRLQPPSDRFAGTGTGIGYRRVTV